MPDEVRTYQVIPALGKQAHPQSDRSAGAARLFVAPPGPVGLEAVFDAGAFVFFPNAPMTFSDSSHPSPPHDLVPEQIIPSLPFIHLARDESTTDDGPLLYLKFFTPDGGWTWYLAGYDRDTRIAYGLVYGFEREWGTFSIDELESVRGRLGLKIERDLHFQPCFANDIRE